MVPRDADGPGQEAAGPDVGAGIRFAGIRHTYQAGRQSLEAIARVDLDVQPGEFVVLVGPSGCGKSTLLHMAAGLAQPTEGAVEMDGVAIDGPDPSRILVFQQPTLFPWLSVRGNIEFGLARAHVPRAERRRRSEAMLEMVQLEGFARSRSHELSGGMRQRVALARALALRPKVLLMDEPFAALDAQTREDLQERLERLWLRDRPTVVFVTHDVGEAARLADRIIVMSHRPGTVKLELPVSVPRPRPIDHPDVVEVARRARQAMTEDILWTRAHWDPEWGRP